MATLTAHCVVRNEENFVGYAIGSIIDFVDEVLVFDTGSTDKTVDVIKKLQISYPNKIILEEKGECDKVRHTQLRQEMVERTKTDWFMVLDGDEVWTVRAMKEAKEIMDKGVYEGIRTGFYECVGDIYHKYYKPGYVTARFVKLGDVYWGGEYNYDTFYAKNGEEFFKIKNIYLLQNKFWHLTHLVRSTKGGDDYSSGGRRVDKRILTYFIVGKKITELPPEVFSKENFHLSPVKSLINFISLFFRKIKK